MAKSKTSVYVDEKFRMPLSERNRRWKRVRMDMALRGIDCLLVYGDEGDACNTMMANLTYLTSLRSRGFFLFPMEHEPIAFVGVQNQFEPYNYFMAVQDWISDVRSADSTLKGGGLKGVIETIKAMGLEKGHIGLVDAHEKPRTSMPYKIYEQLRGALPQTRFSDQTALLTSARLIKSPIEIEWLVKAGQLAHDMMKAMVETCGEGVREIEIYNEMMRVHMEGGGDPHHFILLCAGPVNNTSHMLHGKIPPYCPSQRRIEKGDVVLVEFHASYGGYLAAAEKTVAVGSAEPGLKKLHQVAVECLKSGTAMMRPGVPFNEMVEAFRKPVIREGMKWLELGVHQHGLSSGGFPSNVYPQDREKDMAIRRADGKLANISSFELQPGMVFGHNIDINNPAWRPNVGVMLGDMVLVTNDGPQLLCGTSLELPIV